MSQKPKPVVMLRSETIAHAHCWRFKLIKADCTITGPGQLLQDATYLAVKALNMAFWRNSTLTLLKRRYKHCLVPKLGMSNQPLQCTLLLADDLPTGLLLHMSLLLRHLQQPAALL